MVQANVSPTWPDRWESDYTALIEDIFTPAWIAAASIGFDNVAGGIQREFNAPFPGAAEIVGPSQRAVELVETRGLTYAQALTNEQIKASRSIIIDGLDKGKNPLRLKKDLSQVIGLTDRDAVAVGNFRDRLERQALRARKDKPLTAAMQARLDRRADVKARRLLRARTERIARSEMSWAHNRGQLDAIQAYRDAGWIPNSATVLKQWITAGDELTCAICAPLNGQVISEEAGFGADQPNATQIRAWGERHGFSNPQAVIAQGRSFLPRIIENPSRTVLTPPAHPNCRCSEAVLVR
jgi:hypothetical protein